MGKVTQAEILAALALPGVNGQTLARALGVAPARISEWKSGMVAQPNVTTERLARAVATLTGAAGPVLDVRSYTAGLLVNLEGDARKLLATIAAARVDLGLSPSLSRPTVEAEERAARRTARRGRSAAG